MTQAPDLSGPLVEIPLTPTTWFEFGVGTAFLGGFMFVLMLGFGWSHPLARTFAFGVFLPMTLLGVVATIAMVHVARRHR